MLDYNPLTKIAMHMTYGPTQQPLVNAIHHKTKYTCYMYKEKELGRTTRLETRTGQFYNITTFHELISSAFLFFKLSLQLSQLMKRQVIFAKLSS